MSGEVVRVVLRPELIGGAFLDADCRRVLLLWRDGIVRPVVSRELLVRYLKVLREMGLGPELLRRWSVWFTSEERAIYLGELEVEAKTGLDHLYSLVAEKGSAQFVVAWRKSGASENQSESPRRISAREFLAQLLN